MTSSGKIHLRVGFSWIGILLFTCVLSLLSATPARAQSDGCVSSYGGVIDGKVNPVPPAHIQFDGNCIIRNFPASNPFTANSSFYGNNPTSWLVIFDNVVFTGNMSCDKSQGNFSWFTNGSVSGLKPNCQNIFVPTEKINKQNPAGQTTATIGVPFTYKMTIPVLFDPLSGTVINSTESPNDLHDITVTDDLNATGADLTYVSQRAYWLNGTPIPNTFSNVGGVLTFSNFPVVSAGQQFVIEVTVVLNDTPGNVPGKQFINTAKWQFGRLIGGTFYEPLPGQWGVTPPMTIAGPVPVVTKTGPATMNLGQWGNFGIDVRNTGLSDAWNVSLRDLLPQGATGGMCDLTPQILSAQVFAADGVTPVPGKGPLNPGSDYSLSYSAAPNCQLDITILTAVGRIGPNERLIVRYRTQLDATTQNGVTLTNVAGAIQWFNADSSVSGRKTYTGTLTNGTPGILDNQDAFTVTAALSGYFFEKTVADVTSGANPATTAAPGDKLRYTLRFRTTTQALSNFRIFDELDALNATADFAPGTLTLVASPAGADISATSSTGGSKGTGVIDIRNLSLPVNGEALVQFDITLKSPITNGTVVTNQATLRRSDGTTLMLSDDPNVGGTADPTRVTIVVPTAPAFRVQKISTYLRDPNVLLAGDTLRYTITVKNIGNADAANMTLRDAVPANTTYVAGSTTLNGAAVADVAGVSPLVNGMPINSSANPTPGSMPADASSNPANVATITFDVVVNPSVASGTAISNQGFVNGNGIVDQPSDDPRTPAPNDPTIDVLGSRPVLYAEKRVVLFTALGLPGLLDPGDVLRCTITVNNSAAIAATGVVLNDPVPTNTTYVANSTLLNGSPVGQPDGGAFPLASGITIGTLAPGATAVLQYDLRVNLGTPAGTAISNQAVVSGAGLPNLLTDGDDNPANGAQPTVVVVGSGQQLSISNQVSVVGGGAAVPGAQLEYVLNIQNSGAVPAYNVVITDDLNATQPGQLTYVNQSATLNGSATGVSFAGSTITANYGAASGTLAPDAVLVLKFRATLNANLALGTVVTNTGVAAWGNPTQTARASVSIAVGSILSPGGPGTPIPAVLNGSAWYDANFDDVRDSGERILAGWAVELYRDNQLSQSVATDTNGDYRLTGVEPNDTTGVRYELRFRAPGAGANTALLGRGVSPFTNGLQRISDIVVPSGANVQGLNLAIHPNGVVYNSMARTPVAGATIALLNARSNSPLPASCFEESAQLGQITLADG